MIGIDLFCDHQYIHNHANDYERFNNIQIRQYLYVCLGTLYYRVPFLYVHILSDIFCIVNGFFVSFLIIF